MTSSTAFQAAISNEAGQFVNNFGSYNTAWSGGNPTMAYSFAPPGLSTNNGYLFSYYPLEITFTSGNVRAIGGHYFGMADYNFEVNPATVTLTYSDGTVDSYAAGSMSHFRGYIAAAPLAWMRVSVVGQGTYCHPAVGHMISATLGPTTLPLSGTLTLNDTSFVAPYGRSIAYSVKQGTATLASGSLLRTTSSGAFTINVPAGASGPAIIVWDGSSFLRKSTAVTLAGAPVAVGTVTLLNGDVDFSGEVDAVDIDQVIADFGSTSDINSDVDVSGEVDAVDIDIVIANFGATDE